MNLEDKKGDGAINDKGRSGGKKLTNLAWKGEEGGGGGRDMHPGIIISRVILKP